MHLNVKRTLFCFIPNLSFNLMASTVAIKLEQVIGFQLSFCHECTMKALQSVFYFSFYVFIYSLHRFNAKCSNLNTQACLMGQGGGQDRPAAGLHMSLDARHFCSLGRSERRTCFTLLHIWQTSSTPKPTNSRSHRITHNKNHTPYPTRGQVQPREHDYLGTI